MNSPGVNVVEKHISETQKLYGVMHTTCIYESAYYMHSIHRTRKGAVAEMAKLKARLYMESDAGQIAAGMPNMRYPLEYEGFSYKIFYVRD